MTNLPIRGHVELTGEKLIDFLTYYQKQASGSCVLIPKLKLALITAAVTIQCISVITLI